VKVYRENLMSALNHAIEARGKDERKAHGPDFESCLVAGWKEVLDALGKGERLEIKE
jgi:hypothetical protein